MLMGYFRLRDREGEAYAKNPRFAHCSALAQDLAGAIAAGCAQDAPARMRSRSAEPQPFDRRSVARELGQRPHPQGLVERKLGVIGLAFRPALLRFEIGRCEYRELRVRNSAQVRR